jgi:hypothetical protein
MTSANFEKLRGLLDQPRSQVDQLTDEIIVSYPKARRLEALLGMAGSLPDETGFNLFKRVWPECDDIKEQRNDVLGFLIGFWNEHSPLDFLTEQEVVWMAALPERFRIYRGCGANDVAGLRWTPCRSAAVRDAWKNGERVLRKPMIVSGMVWKQQVLLATATNERWEIVADITDLTEIRLRPLSISDR